MKCNLLNENHNIAPNRYKSTKWGILPCGWGVAKLSDVFDHVSKKNADNSISNVLTNSATKGIVKQSEYFDKQIANDENTCNYFVVEQGDFVYNPRISSSAPCGPFKRYKGDEVGIMSPLYTVYRCKQSNNICAKYLEYYFDSSFWHKYMYSIANYGARSDRMSVTLGDMDKMPIPNPSIEEQEKIAEILDEQDRIIQLKERLLEEKKLQKKYLMQQLLTGKKRLPGFTEPWKKIKLGDVFKLREEKKDSQNLTICSVAINEGVIDQIQHLGKSMAAANTSNYSVVRFGDLVYTKSPTGNFPYGIIKQSQLHAPVAVSPLYGVYIPKSYEFGYMMNEYFSYYNNTNHFLLPIINKGAKNTISIADQTIFEQTLTLPQDNDEIRCLAQLFKDLNIEIDLLQQSIEQEKQKKKALMQLLLTGIVRTFK